MRFKSLLTVLVITAITLTEAAIVKPFIIKVQPIYKSPNQNVIVRVKDAGGSMYGVYGNAVVNGANEPFSGKLSRTLVGSPTGFADLVGDLTVNYMDYTDDSCMTFRTTLPNGHQGVGVARYRPDGTKVYRVVREMTSFAGTETIVGSGIDATGAIYVLGEAQTSATASTTFLARFNPNGTAGWFRSWYQHKPVGLMVFADGSVCMDKLGNFEIQMMKINAAGATLWTQTLTQGQVDPTGKVARYSEFEEMGFVFHTITWTLTDGTVHTALRRMNCQDGTVNWLNDFSIPNGSVRGSSLARTSNDSVVYACIRKMDGTGQTDVALFKLDAMGNQLWDRSLAIEPTSLEYPNVNASFCDPYDEFYELVSGDNGKSHLVKYAPNGTKRWDMVVGTPGENVAQSATMLAFTDIMISSYSFGASQTGSFLMESFQQSAVALNDNYNVNKNVINTPSKAVTFNDRYALGATIAVSQQPLHGTVQMFSNGIFRYTPETGFVGADTFWYTLSKPGLENSVAKVGLNVK